MGTSEKGLQLCVRPAPASPQTQVALEGPSTGPEKNQQAVVPHFVPHQLLFSNERDAPGTMQGILVTTAL